MGRIHGMANVFIVLFCVLTSCFFQTKKICRVITGATIAMSLPFSQLQITAIVVEIKLQWLN